MSVQLDAGELPPERKDTVLLVAGSPFKPCLVYNYYASKIMYIVCLFFPISVNFSLARKQIKDASDSLTFFFQPVKTWS